MYINQYYELYMYVRRIRRNNGLKRYCEYYHSTEITNNAIYPRLLVNHVITYVRNGVFPPLVSWWSSYAKEFEGFHECATINDQF